LRVGLQNSDNENAFYFNSGLDIGFNNILDSPFSLSGRVDHRFLTFPDFDDRMERTLFEANLAFDLCHEIALHAGYQFVNNVRMQMPDQDIWTGGLEIDLGGYQIFLDMAYRVRDDEFKVGITFNSNNIGPILTKLFN
jgi:hypothetical protein